MEENLEPLPIKAVERPRFPHARRKFLRCNLRRRADPSPSLARERVMACTLTSGNAVNRIGRGATQNATRPAGLRPGTRAASSAAAAIAALRTNGSDLLLHLRSRSGIADCSLADLARPELGASAASPTECGFKGEPSPEEGSHRAGHLVAGNGQNQRDQLTPSRVYTLWR